MNLAEIEWQDTGRWHKAFIVGGWAIYRSKPDTTARTTWGEYVIGRSAEERSLYSHLGALAAQALIYEILKDPDSPTLNGNLKR